MKQDSNTSDIFDETELTQPPVKQVFARTSLKSSPRATQPDQHNKRKLDVPASQPHAVPNAAASPHGKIDKLELVLPRALMSTFALEQAGQRLAGLPMVKKISGKSDSYQLKYVLKCPSTAKVYFGLIATEDRMRHGLKINLNPSHMENGEADARAFYHCLKQLFPLGWQDSLAAMLLQRGDHAFDRQVRRNNLIMQLDGSPTEGKFYAQTDRNGEIQTVYCGSIESRIHWSIYDQEKSDEFKRAHGELPSRPKARDDAELVFEKSKVEGMTRFEARRIFAQPLTLREADAQRNPLGNFKVYLVDEKKLASAPENFSLFLDSVRLRGVAGAGKQFLQYRPVREGKKQLALFNDYLATCAAPWWDKSGLDSSIEAALCRTPLWNVLKHLAR